MGAALKEAIKDSETRQLYFLDYLNLETKTRKRGKGQGDDSDGPPIKKKTKGGKDKGKGKGTGKNKNKGKDPDSVTAIHAAIAQKCGFTLVGKTPDKKFICYKFNDGIYCDHSCGMLHICRIKGCYDNHPMVQHKGWDAA